MINWIEKWWRSRQLSLALKQGNYKHAKKRLKQIINSGNRLSWQENLYRDYFSLESKCYHQEKTIAQLQQQIKLLNQSSTTLSLPSDFFETQDHLIPDSTVIKKIIQNFKITNPDAAMVQCTGIDQQVFNDIEENLAHFILDEFHQYSRKPQFDTLLKEAIYDLNGLKYGEDPSYSFELSPHVYLIRYFLENTYCAYLAWFLIYQSGLLPIHLNILDIAAGPGTIAYGLDLFLQSIEKSTNLPQLQISYYSLEKQNQFQYRGLQFWRRYVEKRSNPSNVYFRFDTHDIFDYHSGCKKIPQNFFDFIIVSHCLFYDLNDRKQFHSLFSNLFINSLKEDGLILLIIQDKKLFKTYNFKPDEHPEQEQHIINNLLQSMGLKLVWYKYLTSTAQRGSMKGSEFAQFARQSLPSQLKIAPLMKQYLGLKYELHYALDDYIILAQRSP